ncbi:MULTISPECIES: hypothetical protein [unclassified Pseudomonas]|uniref:hypothetical protein n=1 Tax=unclassified Pseudomonas TaxID=196821 RepID=UPI001F588A60|nr:MULTISPECIES: hypothetical protein [unclassified Pseudomonas]
MKIKDSIILTLTNNYTLESEIENNFEYIAKYSCKELHTPDTDKLSEAISSVPERDRPKISIQYNHTEDNDVLEGGKQSELEVFVKNIGFNLLHVGNESTKITIKITKTSSHQKISIYSIEAISKFWNDKSIEASLLKIKNLSEKANTLEVLDKTPNFSTALFSFENPGTSSPQIQSKVIRDELLLKREKSTNFATSARHNFILEDFMAATGSIPPEIQKIFTLLLLASSLIFICDYSKILEAGDITLKLSGYKTIENTISASKINSTDLNASIIFFEIYKWIYNDGNTIDKIGIARNIISIHLEKDSFISVPQETIASISSGYQIYLKDNLKQYIEIKNKISESVQKSSEKASDLAKNVGTAFRSSIFAIYSFFFSIFLFRIVSGKTPTLEVTQEIYWIFVAFLSISILVCFYSMNELAEERSKLQNSYINIKTRYKDLISEKDLARILNDDQDHLSDIYYINSRGNQTRVLWAASLFIIFLLMTVLRMQSYYSTLH